MNLLLTSHLPFLFSFSVSLPSCRTNITEPHGEYKSSRGQLVSSFLQLGAPHLEQFAHDLSIASSDNTNKTALSPSPSSATDFAGFNLLVLEPSTNGGSTGPLSYNAALITNSGGGGVISSRLLTTEERRLGGLSNGIDNLDGPRWPKVQKGQEFLSQLLENKPDTDSEDKLTELLFKLLT